MPIATPPWTGAITLLHGTTLDCVDSIRAGINPARARPGTDFGPGFYMTSHKDQAQAWARRVAGKRKERPVLIEMTFSWPILSKLRIIAFASDGLGSGYWDIVKSFRDFEGAPTEAAFEDYDLIIGPVARFRKNHPPWIEPQWDQFCFCGAQGYALLNAADKRVSAQP